MIAAHQRQVIADEERVVIGNAPGRRGRDLEPAVTTTIIVPDVGGRLDAERGRIEDGIVVPVHGRRFHANRSALTVLLPNTVVSPIVSDCARLPMKGFRVVSMTPSCRRLMACRRATPCTAEQGLVAAHLIVDAADILPLVAIVRLAT